MEVVGSVEAGGEKQAISFSQDSPARCVCTVLTVCLSDGLQLESLDFQLMGRASFSRA